MGCTKASEMASVWDMQACEISSVLARPMDGTMDKMLDGDTVASMVCLKGTWTVEKMGARTADVSAVGMVEMKVVCLAA